MPKVLIAGGGIAGLEALVALRAHLGSDVEIELLEADGRLVERQRSVAEPFSGDTTPRLDIARIAAEHHARLREDRLASVDAAGRRVSTVGGDVLDYDALLIAIGATADVAVPGALTFAGPRDVGAFNALLAEIDDGRVERIGFALPASVGWTLPLYELALMTAEHVRERGLSGVRLVLITPERHPLDAFGIRIASHVWSLMTARGIAVCTRTTPLRAGPGGLIVAHGHPVQVERIVALARAGGRFIDGLPHDGNGFLEIDEHGAVLGVDGVWAAGDVTSFPTKQGGLAAQQADAAAVAIAAHLGAKVDAKPLDPVLRGLMLDPAGARFLDSRRGDLPSRPLWTPPTKVAAEHLGRYLTSASV
jgi:sulfide:quinone oxidoreductase